MAHVHFVMEVDGEDYEFASDEVEVDDDVAEWDECDEDYETVEDLLDRLEETFEEDNAILVVLDMLRDVVDQEDAE